MNFDKYKPDNPGQKPEELLNKIVSAAQSAGKEIGDFNNQFTSNATNIATLGIPELLNNKIPRPFGPPGSTFQTMPDKPNSLAGEVGQLGGGIAGWTIGAPEMIGKGAIGLLPKATQISSKWIPTFLKGGLKMGAGRVGFIPTNMAEGSNLGEEAKQTGLMAGLGSATSIGGKALFGRQYAAKSMEKGSGGIKDMQNTMYEKLNDLSDKDPNLQHDPYPIYQTVKQAANEAMSTGGKVPPVIRGWIKGVGEFIDNGQTIPARFLEKMRQEASALYKEGTHLKTPTVQNAIRMVGETASTSLKTLAQKAGIKEWGPVTEQASQNWALQNKPSLLHQIVSAGIPGAIGGAGTMAVTGDPRLSAGVGATMAGLSNPFVRNALFAGIERSGLGQVAKAGIGVQSTKRGQKG